MFPHLSVRDWKYCLIMGSLPRAEVTCHIHARPVPRIWLSINVCSYYCCKYQGHLCALVFHCEVGGAVVTNPILQVVKLRHQAAESGQEPTSLEIAFSLILACSGSTELWATPPISRHKTQLFSGRTAEQGIQLLPPSLPLLLLRLAADSQIHPPGNC